MANKPPDSSAFGHDPRAYTSDELNSKEYHPDYVPGLIAEQVVAPEALSPIQDDLPLPVPPFPRGPIPRGPRIPTFPDPRLPTIPQPFPERPSGPIFPVFCDVVSGRYRNLPESRNGSPPPPLPGLLMTVRVDVDRFLPQQRISIEVTRLFPSATAHVIAEVNSDQCLAFNRRRIEATITYRDGDASLIPGDTVTFSAVRGLSFTYSKYTLTLSGAGIVAKTWALEFESQYFDKVEFEVDQVENATDVITEYATASHPNHPASVPPETLSLATVYQRAGFDATFSPNPSTIPVNDAGVNATWSDSEMHNAMVTYWSRFANKPQWALWVLYAARHDSGRSLGGVMFDDIGPNHRQGTAIFTDSFIQDAPVGDPNPVAWRNRMTFWTAVHEMGHAFNLAHSWQKALGNPWIDLANEPEARSFMNYPFNVIGGETSFFSDFRFRFSDDELIFMRHAPRRFVQMGNANWFDEHGFEAPPQNRHWNLTLRPNRDENTYRFLEPVVMELKLTNTGAKAAQLEGDFLADGGHVTVLIQRHGGTVRRWRAMSTQCHQPHSDDLAPGKSVYASHLISAGTDGWLIDEPGFYKIQAAIQLDNEILLSNVQRIYVMPSTNPHEQALALDYFTEDVGRTLAFNGAPALTGANNTLQSLIERCADNPAAIHAQMALSSPMLRVYKRLEIGRDRASLAIACSRPDIEAASHTQYAALLEASNVAACSLGNIHYFSQLATLADSVAAAGDDGLAQQLRQKSLAIMRERKVLATLIKDAEAKLRAHPGT